jgi:hypoxanthine phosphoribosyltransferase
MIENKITDSWFMNQWYSKEELQQLQEWIDKSGTNVEVKLKDSKWSGFHIEDKNMNIDLAGQDTEEDCRNWMKRLSFTVIN